MSPDSVVRMEFTKWIVALSKEDAMSKAKSFLDSQKAIASTSKVLFFSEFRFNADLPRKKVEWFVHSKIECKKHYYNSIINSALKENWESEDEN